MSDESIIGLSRLMTLRQQVDTANQTTSGYKSTNLRFQEYLTTAKEDENQKLPARSPVAANSFTDLT